jgi:hypothetical protein
MVIQAVAVVAPMVMEVTVQVVVQVQLVVTAALVYQPLFQVVQQQD